MARMISCPDCGMMFRVEDDFEGKEANCPVCSRILVVPKPEAPVAPRGAARKEESAKAPAGRQPSAANAGQPTQPAQKASGAVPPPPAAFETPSRRRAAQPPPGEWQLYRPVRRKIDPRWIWLSFGIFAGLVLLVGLVVAVVRLATTAVEPLPEQMRLVASPAAGQPGAPAPSPQPVRRPAATPTRGGPTGRAVTSPPEPATASPVPRTAVPEGPIRGQAAARAARILTAFAGAAANAEQPGVRRIDRGQKLEAEIDGNRFTAVVAAEAPARVLVPGEVELPDGLSIMTTNEWPLSGDVTLPPETYLVFSDGGCRIVDVNRRRREDSEREFYVTDARKALSDAVESQDWPRAWDVVEDLKARYPGSTAARALEADLQAAVAQVVIDVVNLTGQPVTVEVLQQGRQMAQAQLVPNGRTLLALPRGRYVVRYGNARLMRTEGLTIIRSQEWRIRRVTVPQGDDRPSTSSFARASQDIDVVGNPELRARMQAMARRGAVAREVFFTTEQGKLAGAIDAADWDKAWQILADVRAEYPDAPEVPAMAEQLRRAGSPVVIDVVNQSGGPIEVTLERGGATAATADLPLRDRVVLELERGQYSLRYGGPGAERSETVAVDRPQEWRITSVEGLEKVRTPYERASRDLDLAGTLELRARLRAAREGLGD